MFSTPSTPIQSSFSYYGCPAFYPPDWDNYKNIATLKYLQLLYNGDFEFVRRIQAQSPKHEVEIKTEPLNLYGKRKRTRDPTMNSDLNSSSMESLSPLSSQLYRREEVLNGRLPERRKSVCPFDHISNHYQEES